MLPPKSFEKRTSSSHPDQSASTFLRYPMWYDALLADYLASTTTTETEGQGSRYCTLFESNKLSSLCTLVKP